MRTRVFAPLRAIARPLAIPTLICIAAAASAPARADAVFGGSIYEYYPPGPNPTYLYAYQAPPTTGTTFSWSSSCSDCSGWSVAGSGAANFVDGTMGATSTETVTGIPSLPGVGDVTAGVGTSVQYNDTLTITAGGSLDGTAGVLGLEYSLDGRLTADSGGVAAVFFGLNPNSAPAGTEVSLNAPSLPVYNGHGNQIGSLGALAANNANESISDTLSIYVPITYGTPVSIEPYLTTFEDAESTFTGTSDFFSTMTLDAALVFSGTPSDLGGINTDAVISSSSGLHYGPDGIAPVPEPATLALFGVGLGLVAARLSRRRLARRSQ